MDENEILRALLREWYEMFAPVRTGWRLLGERGGGSWHAPSRPRVDKHPLQKKLLWEAV